MLNFLANAKEFQLSDGRVITVNRKPIAHYYLLIGSVIIYKNAMDIVEGLKDKKKISEYIDYMKSNSMDFAKAKVEFENIKKYLKDWSDLDVDKCDNGLIFECLSKVLEFNTLQLSGGGNPIKDIDGLNEQFESVVSTLSILLKREPEYIYSNINNYQACAILHENNRVRVQVMNDVRYAQNANAEEYRKYTNKLLGLKIVSGQEIFNNPALLNEVH